jgi:hypothetical protein
MWNGLQVKNATIQNVLKLKFYTDETNMIKIMGVPSYTFEN